MRFQQLAARGLCVLALVALSGCAGVKLGKTAVKGTAKAGGAVVRAAS